MYVKLRSTGFADVVVVEPLVPLELVPLEDELLEELDPLPDVEPDVPVLLFEEADELLAVAVPVFAVDDDPVLAVLLLEEAVVALP